MVGQRKKMTRRTLGISDAVTVNKSQFLKIQNKYTTYIGNTRIRKMKYS